MPYKFETQKLKIRKEDDRRRKLTDTERQQIKELYGKVSQRKLAKIYNVSRRLIQFIGDPEKKKQDILNFKLRGGSQIYYSKEKQKQYMKTHRKHKKELNNKKRLIK